jgi:hypothetical protein
MEYLRRKSERKAEFLRKKKQRKREKKNPTPPRINGGMGLILQDFTIYTLFFFISC